MAKAVRTRNEKATAQKPAPRESRGTWRVSAWRVGFGWARAIEFMAQACATAAGVAAQAARELRVGIATSHRSDLAPLLAEAEPLRDWPGFDEVVRKVASFLGVSLQYLVRTPGGEELTVIEQNNRSAAQPRGGPVGPGQEVLLAWHPEHTFVVDKETEHVA